MRVKLTIEYDGTNYSGWQFQSGQDSIQQRLETALGTVFSQQVRVRGSGRTDAGVHALAQVAAVDLPRPFPLDDLRRAMNSLLPVDIVILEVSCVPDDFDPRRAAIARVYEYRIRNDAQRSAFEHRHVWQVADKLDFDAMAGAAEGFIGEHNFAAFRSLGTDVKSTVRHVYESSWRREGSLLVYRVEARSFLRHMVRTMVGTMVEIGRGKLDAIVIAELLKRGVRSEAPAAAPARGLFLIKVRYPLENAS